MHVRRDSPYRLRCGTLRRGAAPTSSAPPRLRGVDDPGLVVPLTGEVTPLGRGAESDVVLTDGSVPRRHARVVRDASGGRARRGGRPGRGSGAPVGLRSDRRRDTARLQVLRPSAAPVEAAGTST
ncbi:FHA domain-containing protein [Streptomyces sp. NPDC051079]|uniref:FHA domain-containing protein n=1 Tax=Streptomyces sp. NPDC051079 TaxID=3155043 RepID=UPI00344BF7C3